MNYFTAHLKTPYNMSKY